MSASWQVGQVVRLKSGGPRMTVSAIRGDAIECTWFFGQERKVETFDVQLLEGTEEDDMPVVVSTPSRWRGF